MDPQIENTHYILPDSLRAQLGKPIGKLIEGSVTETIPKLKEELLPKSGKIIGVGDVTADILVKHEFEPDIIITDGKTKRQELDEWPEYRDFRIIRARCPAAQITPDAWQAIKKSLSLSDEQPVQIMIDGEEDLLVLPLIIEAPEGSMIVYGQPNTGAVIRQVTSDARDYALEIINKMNIKS